jgi:hypothetical protein
MNNEFRDLTDEEIGALPIELKVCFMLQGWNNLAEINSVDDWKESFWVFWANTEDAVTQECKTEAKEAMERDWKDLHHSLVLFGIK